jgi:proteasome lid subunit RPN8/RPN11
MTERARVVLARKLRDELVAHARAAAPQECCGLVMGEDEIGRRVLRCRNVHPTPETRYLVDKTQLFEAFRAAADFDRELVAIYHSHPRSPAYPSPTDRAEALWPEAAYVLVSLRSEEPEIFAYRIKAGAVSEIPIEMSG